MRGASSTSITSDSDVGSSLALSTFVRRANQRPHRCTSTNKQQQQAARTVIGRGPALANRNAARRRPSGATIVPKCSDCRRRGTVKRTQYETNDSRTSGDECTPSISPVALTGITSLSRDVTSTKKPSYRLDHTRDRIVTRRRPRNCTGSRLPSLANDNTQQRNRSCRARRNSPNVVGDARQRRVQVDGGATRGDDEI